MLQELKWLVGVSLVGLSLLQLATNTRVEAKVCAPPPPPSLVAMPA